VSAARGHATRHWRNQRLSALTLLPLGGWFLWSLLALPDPGYDSVRGWLAAPAQSALMLLFAWCALWHSALGVQVILEDYVGGAWYGAARWSSRLAHLGAALAVAWALAAMLRGAPA